MAKPPTAWRCNFVPIPPASLTFPNCSVFSSQSTWAPQQRSPAAAEARATVAPRCTATSTSSPHARRSRWEIHDQNDTALILALPPSLLDTVAEEQGFDSRRVEIRNRFQIRDAQLENICWALKVEMEAGYPSGRLYTDSLGVSIASRLVSTHSSVARAQRPGAVASAVAGSSRRSLISKIISPKICLSPASLRSRASAPHTSSHSFASPPGYRCTNTSFSAGSNARRICLCRTSSRSQRSRWQLVSRIRAIWRVTCAAL